MNSSRTRLSRSPVPLVLGTLLALAAGSACGGSSENGGGSTKMTGADFTEARQVFTTICATCHGAEGKGDGPGAANLDPKPRTFTDRTWQQSVTDEHIKKTVIFGGAAVGKSPNMPAQPQLRDKDGVLNGLVKIVRGFGH